MSDMTRREREDLAKLVRRREKLAKADVDSVAADRLADFEQRPAAEYKPADDPVWKDAHAFAAEALAESNAKIAERCRELGIQERFAPKIATGWLNRGENAAAGRRAELRKVAQTRLVADAKLAKAEIERSSIGIQEELIAGGLESTEASEFLASLPTAAELMPGTPSVDEIEALDEIESGKADRRARRWG